MKEKENETPQAGNFTFGQAGWLRDSVGRNASEVCPQCGGKNSLDRGGDAERSRKTSVFKCSNCDWQEYPQRATETTNRHGLV